MITKAAAKKALGLDTDAALARLFGIGRWAVGQWPEHAPLPPLRVLQLHDWYPQTFPHSRDREPHLARKGSTLEGGAPMASRRGRGQVSVRCRRRKSGRKGA